MAVKVKPVQATEIKDKKMVRKIIKQIRKPISPEIIERNRKIDEKTELFMK
jgi:glycine cleavage system H lipoate-binding protein